MSGQNSLLLTIKEGTAVRVAIPLKGLPEKIRYNCFFGTQALPEFSLVFPPNALDFNRIDMRRACRVMVDYADQTISVSADITEVQPPCVVKLVEKETVSHTQTRNYFRVDATTRVSASSCIPEAMAHAGESWRLLGDTIDLSGSGVLCSFDEPLDPEEKVKIELTLPSPEPDTITAFGHVVRCRKINEGLYHIALHFDMITPENQDKIMACCFALQRKYLRMRVQLQNSTANE